MSRTRKILLGITLWSLLLLLLWFVYSATADTAVSADLPTDQPLTQPTSPPPNTDAGPGAALSVIPLGQEVVSQHFLTLPVAVDGAQVIAILDTGIGLALISQALCDRNDCDIDGTFTGQRMSGQSVTIPLTTLASLQVGAITKRDVRAGVIDIEGFFPDPQIQAFVGLPFFESQPFTLDGRQALVLESEASLVAIAAQASEVPARLHRQGVAIDLFAPVLLPTGEQVEVLVDTGSHGVTLDLPAAGRLGLDLNEEDPAIERREGVDETGHSYQRYFTTLASLGFASASPAPPASRDLRVMFQEIIHEGLVGTQFLSAYRITFDLPRTRLLIRPR